MTVFVNATRMLIDFEICSTYLLNILAQISKNSFMLFYEIRKNILCFFCYDFNHEYQPSNTLIHISYNIF